MKTPTTAQENKMKKKYYLYSAHPEGYLSNPEGSALIARTDQDNPPDDWIFIGEASMTIKVGDKFRTDLVEKAVDNIDREITQTRARLQSEITGLEERKSKFLAITQQVEA